MELAARLPATRSAFRAVFGGVALAMFLASADQTILAAALPAIGAALGGLEHVSWLAVAYLIAATVAAPLYGHLGDRFGRRRMLLGALALFTAASALCALAPTLAALLAARVLQGLGAGGLMTLSQALIGERLPPRERPRFQGYFASIFALSSTLGPLIGGYLTEHLSWRMVFAVNLPLGALAAFLALRVPAQAPASTAGFRPDVAGTMLFAAAVSALLLALSGAAERTALLAAAGAAAAALLWWERRAADPLIPLRLLAVAAIARADALVFCFAAALLGTVLYLPLFLQLDRGFAPGASALLLLPITLAIAVASAATGKLISATRRLTIFPAAGLALSTAAFATLAATVASAPTPLMLALAITAALGLGTVMPACQIIVQEAAGGEALGAATASISVCRSIGGAFGAALAGALVLGAAPARLGHAFGAMFVALAALTALGCAFAVAIPRRML
jgi:EmrB/QacA subfamily drug resistance transporter